MNKIQNEVVKFIANFQSLKESELKMDYSLLYDLGIDGDDAEDLIVEYAKKFNVNIDEFVFDDYFGPESIVWGMILSVKNLFYHKSPFKVLMVEDMVRGAIEGRLR